MAYSIGAGISYIVSAAGSAGAAGSAAAVGEGAAAAGTAAAGTGAAAAGGAAAAAGGAAAGSGIGLGTVAAVGSLASTAYALSKGVPKVPTPGTLVPADNATAIANASDAASRARAQQLAGGMTSTMLTGGAGLSSPGTTTSKMLGGS